MHCGFEPTTVEAATVINRPFHSNPLKPAPEPMENLAPSLLGQEDSNDQYQQAAEENYAGRNSLQAKEQIHTDSLRLVLQSGHYTF